MNLTKKHAAYLDMPLALFHNVQPVASFDLHFGFSNITLPLRWYCRMMSVRRSCAGHSSGVFSSHPREFEDTPEQRRPVPSIFIL